MCDLCTKHGEGKIWYKNAKNYADDLPSDLGRRRYIENFLTTAFSEGFQTLGRLETIYRSLPRGMRNRSDLTGVATGLNDESGNKKSRV